MVDEQDKIAAVARARLALAMRTQTEVAQKIGISRDILNKFLRRKINLLDTQIEKLLREIGLHKQEIQNQNILSFLCDGGTSENKNRGEAHRDG